jgi:hypothetical protein
MATWETLPALERQQRQAQGVAAWRQWATDHATSILEMGGPLSRTKTISRSGIADTRNNMSAYTVIQAESHEAAASLFINHPHFMLFPGDGVEVMEVMSIPNG